MGKPFYAYLLRCSDGSYYAGHTDDLMKRLAEHATGGKCAYTTRRRPVRLAWSREFATRLDAKMAERRIKSWSRAKKEALIRGDFAALHELAKKRDWEGYRERKMALSPKPAPRYAEPAARLLGASEEADRAGPGGNNRVPE